MNKKNLLMLGGGAVVVGVLAMYAITRKQPPSATAAPVAGVAQSLGIPPYPSNPIPPAPINISDAPVFQTINIMPTRQTIPPMNADDCKCCATGVGQGADLTPAQLAWWAANVGSSGRVHFSTR